MTARTKKEKIRLVILVIAALVIGIVVIGYLIKGEGYKKQELDGAKEKIEQQTNQTGEISFVQGEKINEKYSFKDFTGASLRDVPVEELNSSIIMGSCFYQENKPDTKVFSDDMRGVVFKRCNLNNVYIPPGNTVVLEGPDKCSNERIKEQNDWEMWVVDENMNPIEPLNKEDRIKAGVSISPKDIPSKRFTIEEKIKFDEKLLGL